VQIALQKAVTMLADAPCECILPRGEDPVPEVATIVSEVLDGHTDRYARIVDLYQNSVWALASAMLYRPSDTEDVVQEVFVRAYGSLDRYDPGQDFGTWLNGIARNVVRQHLRGRARKARHLSAYREALERRLERPDDDEARRTDLAAALRLCREQLPEESRDLIQLRYEHGLDFDEIVRRVKRTRTALRQLLYRIRLALKECVQKRMGKA
jgi:RNA polymerase sigma-70 factor (ECF subfamily)